MSLIPYWTSAMSGFGTKQAKKRTLMRGARSGVGLVAGHRVAENGQRFTTHGTQYPG